MKPATSTFLVMLAFITVLLPLGCAAEPASMPFSIQPTTLSGTQLGELYLDTLERYANYAVTQWTPWTSAPQAGYFGNGISTGNEGIRASGGTAFIFALLYKERSEYKTTHLTREQIKEKAIAAIRYIALTHITGPFATTDGKHWGQNWQSSLWTGNFGLAAWLLWDELDDATKAIVEKVIVYEASALLVRSPGSGLKSDTKAEENAWDTNITALAASMFPEHRLSGAWREASIKYMMNTLSTASDDNNNHIVDGRKVQDWVFTTNIYPDFTLENHGFFHPTYAMVSAMSLGDSALFYRMGNMAVPEAAGHHVPDVWRLLQGLVLADGDWAYPSGLDWELHDYEQISFLAWMATYWQDPIARTVESRLAQYMAQRQLINGDGRYVGASVPGRGLFREAVQARRVGLAYLHHKLWGTPDNAMPFTEFDKAMYGAKSLSYVGIVTHRTPDKFASVSWQSKVMGYVVPQAEGHLGNPYVVTPYTSSLIGSVASGKTQVIKHNTSIAADGFASTAHIAQGVFDRYIAVQSLPGSPVTHLELTIARESGTLKERAVPIAIENDELNGDHRNLYTKTGTVVAAANQAPWDLPLSGSWINIDDRMGVVTTNGGFYYQKGRNYNRPGAREDILYIAKSSADTFIQKRQTAIDRITIVLPNSDRQSTAQVAVSLKRLSLPAGLAGMTFTGPDGAVNLVLANFTGPSRASVTVVVEHHNRQEKVVIEVDQLTSAYITWHEDGSIQTNGVWVKDGQQLIVRSEPPAV